MDYKQLWKNISTSYYFYIILAVIFLLLVVIFYNIARKRKLQKKLDALNIKYKSLDSQPFNVKLTQSQALARTNQEIRNAVQQCEEDYQHVIEQKKEILNLLVDCDEYLSLSKIKLAMESLASANEKVATAEKDADNLSRNLQAILEQSAIYLNKVNDLQTRFHDIKQKVNNNPEQFFICWEALEKKSAAISHLFSNMNAATNVNHYDEAEEIGKQIEESIKEFDLIVADLPELVSVARAAIPARITEVENAYNALKQKGAYLNHLDIQKNIDFINQSLQTDVSSIEKCDITDVNNHLFQYQTRLNQLLSQINSEEESYKKMFELLSDVDIQVKQAIEKVRFISANFESYNEKYGLNRSKSENLEVVENTKQLTMTYSQIIDTIKAKSVPASTLVISLSKLQDDCTEMMKNINRFYNSFNDVQLEEKKAREIVERYSIVLNEIEVNIRLNRLPKLSDQFNIDLQNASEKLNAVNSLISTVPIDIAALKEKEKDLSEFVMSLHEKINSIIVMNDRIEKYIVICNRYRGYYSEVDNELTRAELSYRNGDFSSAYSICRKIMEKVAPKLLEE